MSAPLKFGGPGYVDICLNEYPEHMKDPYGRKPLKKGDVKKQTYAPFYSGFSALPFFYENPYTDEKDDPPKKPTYINREKPPKKVSMKAPFMPTSPAKKMGNNHDGCFTPFPENMKEPYMNPWVLVNFVKGKKQPKKKYAPFIPTFSQLKTMQVTPTLAHTEVSMNGTNYKTYTPKYVKYL